MSEQLPEGQDTAPEGADTGRPDYLLPKFATEADQARAYAEAEKEMQRLRSLQAEQEQQFTAALERMESFQQEQTPPVNTGLDPQTSQLVAQYERAVADGDAAAQLAIQLGLNQQIMAQVIDEKFKTLDPKLQEQSQADRNIAFEIAKNRIADEFGPEWKDLQPDVQKWLTEHQSWLPTKNEPDAFANVIREAARTVKNEKAAEKYAESERDRAAKLAAATGDGSGQGRHPIVTDAKRAAWKEVEDADLNSYGSLRQS